MVGRRLKTGYTLDRLARLSPSPSPCPRTYHARAYLAHTSRLPKPKPKPKPEPEPEPAPNEARVHLVDLCCGKGLTTALAAHNLPLSTTTAVDLYLPTELPHFEARDRPEIGPR